MFLFSVAAVTTLIFCMLVVKTTAGVVVFAALYGFFSGTCTLTILIKYYGGYLAHLLVLLFSEFAIDTDARSTCRVSS